MNVNLTSATESTKLTKGGREKTTSSDETSEAEGFFAKLTAMLKGESKAELETTDVAVETNSEETSEDDAVKIDATAGKSTDAVLNSAESEANLELSEEGEAALAKKVSHENAEDGQSTNEKTVGDKAVVIPKELEKFIENADEQKLMSSEVEQTVAESEELLGRLDQSSKALQQVDGNTLPQQQVDQSQQTSSSPLPVEETLTTSSVLALSDNQTIEANATQASELLPAEGESLSVAIEGGVAPAGEVVEATEVEAVEVATPAIQASQIPADQIQANGTAVATEGEVTVTQGEVKLNESMDDLNSELSEEAVQPAAIAWQSTSTSTNEVTKPVSDDVLDKQANKPVIHQAAANQQLQANLAAAQTQGTNQTSSATNASVLTPATPMDLSAVQQLQASVALAVKPEQAILQATMGAKAAATLGKIGQQGETSNNGVEASFAQQLGQAAGQNSVNGLVRAEPTAQPQPTMQLNREMASEQVSERIQMMMSKNLKNIDIRLDPPELGRMQIRMNMNGDNATVHFTVANQQARDIVEQAMPRLREMLAQQGLQLGDTSVQQQASGQQQGQYATSNEDGTGQGNSIQSTNGEENLEPDVKLDLNVASKRDGISYYA
ncbi:flagellar hook-length control protein FliK [Vibrio kasasachensis]|uniref:flagellar hook-length control protein FliK n=1 Tax=Vibrio kasasachensis TaxID=2910248 RepID=UPI003D124C1F